MLKAGTRTDKLSDVYVEALLNTLAKTTAHKDKLNDVHYYALVNTLPVSLA